MEPIRILQVVGAMNRGGTETLLMELYRHIDRSKVQFDFLVYNYSGEPGAYDEEIVRLGGKIYEAKRRFYRGPWAYCRELSNFFKEHPEYQIVHSHLYKTSGYILRVAKKAGVYCTIAHGHTAYMNLQKNFANFLRWHMDLVGGKFLRKYADYYLGCANAALQSLVGVSANEETAFVLRNAVNCEKFKFQEKYRTFWREQWGINENTLIVGNVARFSYHKNHEHVLRTFYEICSKQEDSLLVLIGTGPLQAEMQVLAVQLGIDQKVLFLNARDDVHQIENAFDVFLMPSRCEGLGIVLIEAQANGLPCVISDKVIPEEVDVHSGLISRVDLTELPVVWAEACLNSSSRLNASIAEKCVKEAGYDIDQVSSWLQEFYISRIRKGE